MAHAGPEALALLARRHSMPAASALASVKLLDARTGAAQ